MKKYKLSWKHCLKGEPTFITEEMILKIVDEGEGRVSIRNNIKNLFREKEYHDRTYSTCTIEDTETSEIISTGLALLSPQDTFNKKIGIQISFTHAVSLIGDRELRTLLWKQYLKDHKIVKKLK